MREPKRVNTEALLAEGLDLFARDRVAEAIACWQCVLAVDPGDARARDFIESAQVAAPVPAGPVLSRLASAGSVTADVGPSRLARLGDPEPNASQQLREALRDCIRERRFEDALTMLLDARANGADDPGIEKSMRLIKARLMEEYIGVIGSLDGVPHVPADIVLQELSVEAQVVVRMIDGNTSYDDLLITSRLGQFRTLRTLAHLVKAHVVLPKRRSRNPSVGAVSRILAEPEPGLRNASEAAPGAVLPAASAQGSLAPVVAVAATGAATSNGPLVEAVAELNRAPEVSTPPPLPIAPDASNSTLDPYEIKFRAATRAYLVRDYALAQELFLQCVTERPHDSRASHNLETLKKRQVKI